jgi:hypothetical protein
VHALVVVADHQRTALQQQLMPVRGISFRL